MVKGFAPINDDLSYWRKQKSKPLFPDLAWNIPEQRTGHVTVIGGNIQSFSNVIRTAEFLNQHFPIKHVSAILPESLRAKLPSMENINFTTATSNGAFAKSHLLNDYFDHSDFNLLIGDLSRNAETAVALSDACIQSSKPLLLTRDSIDLLAESSSQLLTHDRLFLVASMPQLQKVFRAAYYPRMILLSQPLVPVIETLHKFTLSYPVTILTFHSDHIIVANSGQVTTTHILDTTYSPIALWSGQLAAKITAFNLFNPSKPLEATTAAILYE